MKKCIKATDGYRYQLNESYIIQVPIFLNKSIQTEWLELSQYGHLSIKTGYAWDGPSGPTIDTDNFIRASLIHDALYQLFRLKLLNARLRRKTADKILKAICKEDGMSFFRREYVYRAVRLFGATSASHRAKRESRFYPKKC